MARTLLNQYLAQQDYDRISKCARRAGYVILFREKAILRQILESLYNVISGGLVKISMADLVQPI